jgi:ribosome biogenesis GTPase
MVGHSGVGKSTLVNRLVPEAARAVGTVSAIGRGRHTSTSAVALRLPPVPEVKDHPGWIVDTPGVRSFGLGHVSPDSVLHGFPDLVQGTIECPVNCEHTAGEIGCKLDAWVAAGNADARRLASYRRLLASRSGDTE